MDLIIEHKRAWSTQRRPDWTQFCQRLCVGPPGQFQERLSRARLLYLRRRESTHNWLALALALVLLPAMMAPAPARAATGSVQAGSLMWRDGGGEAQVALRLDTRVQVRVSGMIARVTVRQLFRNDSSEWRDGVYRFPLTEKAAVDRLRMHIGERVIVGEIREREAARKVYEQARSAGKQTSLVEHQRPNLFTTSVANVAPGATVEVQIGYLESLDYDGGQWRLRIPLTITPRYQPGGNGAGDDTIEQAGPQAQRADIRVSIDAGVRLAEVKSLHHPVQVTDLGRSSEVALKDGMVAADRDFELVWTPEVGMAPAAALFTETVGEDSYALLMLLSPQEQATQRRRREVIFVIDTSGSMQGPALVQAREALVLALERLQAEDLFNVIQFNSTAESLFATPQPADTNRLHAARDYVRALTANGGTEMRSALQAALAMPAGEAHLRQIVFITDGAVGNEEELFALIAHGLGAGRLFTVGIGPAPNGHFMRRAAAAGRGTFTFIGDAGQVRERMGELLHKIENPALTGVELQWPAGVRAELAVSKVPDLYYGEPVVVTARLQGTPAGLLALTGQGASGPWLHQAQLDGAQPGGARSHQGVAALWARHRIEDLLDRRRTGADPQHIRKQVLDLALTHHLVSPYTSLVAVDRTPARPAWAQSVSGRVPNTAPAGSAWAGTNVAYPATATHARMNLLAGCVLLLLALLLFVRAPVRVSGK